MAIDFTPLKGTEEERKVASDRRIAEESKRCWEKRGWPSKAARRQERARLSGNRQGFHS